MVRDCECVYKVEDKIILENDKFLESEMNKILIFWDELVLFYFIFDRQSRTIIQKNPI